jgi:hypothetical protein
MMADENFLNSIENDNVECENNEAHPPSEIKKEKWWQITIQVSIPFFLAGVGTIAAGVILGNIEVSNCC